MTLPPDLAVVVVAEDAKARKTAGQFFRMTGCDAFGAMDGFEALEVLKSNRDRQVVILAEPGQRTLERPEFAVAAGALVPNVRIATAQLDAYGHGPSEMNFDALYHVVVEALSD